MHANTLDLHTVPILAITINMANLEEEGGAHEVLVRNTVVVLDQSTDGERRMGSYHQDDGTGQHLLENLSKTVTIALIVY